MSFKKEKPITPDKLHIGCLHCSTACLKAPMDMILAVEFCQVIKDGKIIYDDNLINIIDSFYHDYLRLIDIEMMAKKDPDHDWRIIKETPLHGETFQRQGDENWVCIESNRGFA